MIKERTHRWNINTATVQQTLIEESFFALEQKQKAPGFSVFLSQNQWVEVPAEFCFHTGTNPSCLQTVGIEVMNINMNFLSHHFYNIVQLTEKCHCLLELTTLQKTLSLSRFYADEMYAWTLFYAALCKHVWTQQEHFQSLVKSRTWACRSLVPILNVSSKVMSDWQNQPT